MEKSAWHTGHQNSLIELSPRAQKEYFEMVIIRVFGIINVPAASAVRNKARTATLLTL